MITELAKDLLSLVDTKMKDLAILQKALKTLASPNALESPQKVEEACKQLAQSDPEAAGLEVDFTELLESAAADQRHRANIRRVEFGRLLKQCAEEKGVEFRLITTDPMEFSIEPFTVVVDLEQNLASILYARLTLEELPAKPERIMTAVEKNFKVLESGWAPEQFFDALYKAYETCLFEKKASRGERAPLKDLLPFVALAFQTDKFRADPMAANYRAYGRSRMAYDLSKLRRSGLLQRNGKRLNLGAATGSSTRNKKDVLYVEESPGQGQYYFTIWFSGGFDPRLTAAGTHGELEALTGENSEI
jgi:hypothetical protein